MPRYSRKKGRNIKKSRKIRRIRRKRGGVKTTRQVQSEFMKDSTPITDPIELQNLEEANRIAEERERNNNKVIKINNDLEMQRLQGMKGWAVTPMSQEDIRKQKKQDKIDNDRINSEEAKERDLTIFNLGGSKRKKTMKKRHRNRRMKGGDVDKLGDADFNANLAYDAKQYGGQNIGANCNDPNFSIYNTRELTLFPYNPN